MVALPGALGRECRGPEAVVNWSTAGQLVGELMVNWSTPGQLAHGEGVNWSAPMARGQPWYQRLNLIFSGVFGEIPSVSGYESLSIGITIGRSSLTIISVLKDYNQLAIVLLIDQLVSVLER